MGNHWSSSAWLLHVFSLSLSLSLSSKVTFISIGGGTRAHIPLLDRPNEKAATPPDSHQGGCVAACGTVYNNTCICICTSKCGTRLGVEAYASLLDSRSIGFFSHSLTSRICLFLSFFLLLHVSVSVFAYPPWLNAVTALRLKWWWRDICRSALAPQHNDVNVLCLSTNPLAPSNQKKKSDGLIGFRGRVMRCGAGNTWVVICSDRLARSPFDLYFGVETQHEATI